MISYFLNLNVFFFCEVLNYLFNWWRKNKCFCVKTQFVGLCGNKIKKKCLWWYGGLFYVFSYWFYWYYINVKYWIVAIRTLICVGKSNTSKTAIAIAIPVVIVGLVLCFLCIYLRVKKKKRKNFQSKSKASKQIYHHLL